MAHKLTLVSDLSKVQALHEAGLLWEECTEGADENVAAMYPGAWVLASTFSMRDCDSSTLARLNGTHKNFRIGLLLEE